MKLITGTILAALVLSLSACSNVVIVNVHSPITATATQTK